jgi:hypothetical protein
MIEDIPEMQNGFPKFTPLFNERDGVRPRLLIPSKSILRA